MMNKTMKLILISVLFVLALLIGACAIKAESPAQTNTQQAASASAPEPTTEPTAVPEDYIEAKIINFADAALGLSGPGNPTKGDIEDALVTVEQGEKDAEKIFGVILLVDDEAVVMELKSLGSISELLLTHDDYTGFMPMMLSDTGSILFPLDAKMTVIYESGKTYEFKIGETIKVKQEDDMWVPAEQ